MTEDLQAWRRVRATRPASPAGTWIICTQIKFIRRCRPPGLSGPASRRSGLGNGPPAEPLGDIGSAGALKTARTMWGDARGRRT